MEVSLPTMPERNPGIGVVLLTCIVSLGAAAAVARAADRTGSTAVPSAAVFDFEFVNWSQEVDYGADNSTEIERLDVISPLFRQLLRQSDRYTLLDTDPAAKRILEINSLHGCNGCDADIASDLGADLAITGVVNKVSNMELSMNIRVRDARTGRIVAAYQADIRGNTDESWTRAVAWLMKNRILKP